MAKTTPPKAQLYYSDVVIDKIAALAADGSDKAHRYIAQQHAIVLGLALQAETASSLSVAHVSLPQCVFESDSSPFTYSAVLTDALTHLASVRRSSVGLPTVKVKLAYVGVPPVLPPAATKKPRVATTYDPIYNPANNNWVSSHVLAPAFAKRYTLDGKPCSLREHLLAMAAMADVELEEWHSGQRSQQHHMWMTRKGVMFLNKDSPAPDRLMVRLLPEQSSWNNMRLLLEATHGTGAIDLLREYAGPAAHLAPNGNLVLDFVLHRTTHSPAR